MAIESATGSSSGDTLIRGWDLGECQAGDAAPDDANRDAAWSGAEYAPGVLNFALPQASRAASGHGDCDLAKSTAIASEGRMKTSHLDGSQPIGFPRIGSTIGGFWLRAELGQGAFARVYLAEQCMLANREVALKVSEALGDEPQALARLQHAHIVPIHSVHDDPDTGFRLLCMPYLGGANLAQVLDLATHGNAMHDGGRSLVLALDRLALSQPNAERSRRTRQLLAPGQAERALDVDQQAKNARTHSPSPTRVRSAFARYLGRLSWSRRTAHDGNPSVAPQDGRSEEQPALRFYRGNSFVRTSAWIIARLAEALEHAHARGILHRDLKPSNVLIAADGTPMLLDFNLSETHERLDGESGSRARVGGTLPYMAPEHLDAFSPSGKTKAAEVDERSDIYSLGLIFYEMLAGQHPFSEPESNLPLADAIERMIEERRTGLVPLRRINPLVPPSLEAVVNRCLAFDRAARCPSANELAEDLRRFLEDLPMKHAPEPSLRERASKWLRRHPRSQSAGTVAALALGLIAVIGLAAWSIADRLQSASAVLERDRFTASFQQAQLLLNTSNGPESHLSDGLRIANASLAAYNLDGNRPPPPGWERQPRLARLPLAERNALLQDLAELLILRARAQVRLSASLNASSHLRGLEGAIASLNVAERIDPSPPSALFSDRAHYKTVLGLTGEAKADLSRARQNPSKDARDYYLQGTALAAEGRNDEAVRLLGQAVVLETRRFWAWFVLGLCHYDLGQYAEAASDFASCTLLSPRFAWPHLNRGLALAALGRVDEALTAFDKAIELSPHFLEARVNRALVRLRMGRYEEARDDMEFALRSSHADPAHLTIYAEALAALGRTDKAGHILDSVVEAHPQRADLRVARGLFRLQQGRRVAAEADLREALNVSPRNPRAHIAIAHLLRGRDPAAAIEHLNLALEQEPANADAVQLRGLLLARLGDPRFEADVDRLVAQPTALHLYNGACALAVFSKVRNDSSKLPRAGELLRRSLAAGFPRDEARADPDLQPLRDTADYRGLFEPSTLGAGPVVSPLP